MDDGDLSRHGGNPAIERMVAILKELEKAPTGLGLKQLTERTGVARSTVYRILNSLLAHRMVRQLENADYILGSRFLAFADAVIVSGVGSRLARIAQPYIDLMAMQLGETVKVSVYDRGSVLVVAVATGRQPHAFHAAVGDHLPAHAGGASKVLIAAMSPAELESALSSTLTRFTEETRTDRELLRQELVQVREQGYARDDGEFNIAVLSYAAPIRRRGTEVVGAVSIPFLAGRGQDYELHIRDAALTVAGQICRDLD